MQAARNKQEGFGLLAMVTAILAVAVAFVIGYETTLAQKVKNNAYVAKMAYLQQVESGIQDFYAQHAFALDQAGMGNPYTAQDLLSHSGEPSRYEVQAALSNVLQDPSGVAYRVLVLYTPSDTDSVNPPDLSRFSTQGVFSSCQSVASPCAQRAYVVFSSLELERKLTRGTEKRLDDIAAKAQVYFADRRQLDPEKDITRNYFNSPYGSCNGSPLDLGCFDSFDSGSGSNALATQNTDGSWSLTATAKNLGASLYDVLDAWGNPIQVSNNTADIDTFLGKSLTSPQSPPFMMLFRAYTPGGAYLQKAAIEPL
jgi:hypothetical protein